MSMKEMVETIHVFALLQQIWSDPYRSAEFHNRSLKLPEACVNIVKFLKHFQRCYVPQSPLRSSAQNTDVPFYASTTFHPSGKLKEITNDYVHIIHEEWKLTMARVASIRQKFPYMTRPRFGKAVAKAMMTSGRQVYRNGNVGTVNRRSASVPLIADGKPKRIAWTKRSRSTSPHHLSGDTKDDRQSDRDEEVASQSSNASQLASGWVLVQ